MATNKDARIQFKQATYYIELLEQNGTLMSENITKRLTDNIWELRPGNNRVFYFFFKDDIFVLLHHFRKKSQKTPKREIEQAEAERLDYLVSGKAALKEVAVILCTTYPSSQDTVEELK